MNEIENAILEYYDENLVFREQAFEICSRFQTINFFDWNIWASLSNFSKPNVVRAFAYKTLSVIIQNEWEQLLSDDQFLSHFPFYNPETFNNDPIKNLILNANSIFLLYLSPLEIIIQLFDQDGPEHLIFISSLLTEFVSCTYSQVILPTERKEIVDQFMFIHLPQYVQKLILQPLSQLEINSQGYSFFLSLLGKIHRDFISPEILLCSSEVVDFYASFAPYVWLESENLSIVWIFDSLFSRIDQHSDNKMIKTDDKSEVENSFLTILEPIILSLAKEVPELLLQSHDELFIQEQEPSERYPNLLMSFLARIPIFFGMLELLDCDTILPYFEIINEMLQSSSPTVIYETSKHIDELIKSLSKFTEFTDDPSFFKYRMEFFETCIKIIAIQLELLPGAVYDDDFDSGNIRSSIFNLATTISRIDTETVIKELIEFIMEQDTEDMLLISLIRLLSASLNTAISPAQAEIESISLISEDVPEQKEELNPKETNEAEKESEDNGKEESTDEKQNKGNDEKSEQVNDIVPQKQQDTKNIIEISEEANKVTKFLLCIIPEVSRSTSNHIFTVLTKLVPFIDFSEEELSDFFSDLFDLFILMKPSSFDSFTSYFTSFFAHFSESGLSLPIDQLNSITPDDPVYYTVRTLIAKFTGQENTLDSALNDIDWFISEFNPEEQESIDHLNRHIQQSFDFIGKNPPKPEENEIGLEILSKIVESNNVLINLANSIQDENIQRLVSPISHLSNAIVILAKIFPSAMLSLLENFQPPLSISPCTVVWLKKIALPIFTSLISPQNYEDQEEMNSALLAISEYSTLIESNLIQEIEIICSDSEIPIEIENYAKKTAVILIQLCRFIENESDAFQIMSICLKLNDFRCLANVIDISAERGIQFFAQFWEEFIERRETTCRDKLCEALYYLYDKEKGNLSQFLQLPGVTQEQIASLDLKLQNCGAAKTKRKYIRLLIPP